MIIKIGSQYRVGDYTITVITQVYDFTNNPIGYKETLCFGICLFLLVLCIIFASSSTKIGGCKLFSRFFKKTT